MVLDLGLGQGEQGGEVVVEALGDVAGHFHMLDLVAAHGHFVGAEHENVGRHQHRIAEQAHGHPEVRILPRFLIGLDRGLVGVGAVHQALGGTAAEDPGQLGDLRDIRLPIEYRTLGIQPQRQPGGGNLLAGLAHHRRILALDQGVVVRQEQERLRVGSVGSGNRGTYRAYIVAEVGGAGGGNASENALFAHDCPDLVKAWDSSASAGGWLFQTGASEPG